MTMAMSMAIVGVQPGLGRAWGRLGRAALMLGQEEEVKKLKIIFFGCNLMIG